MKKNKTICFFGKYDPEYSRNKCLIHGLRQNGVEVIECNTVKNGFGKFADLYQKHKLVKNKYNTLYVAFPGQIFVPLAKLISRKNIIFDAFTSLYDSNVFDRHIVKEKSFKAKFYWFLDYLACLLADLVIIDTKENAKYFSQSFKINKEKIKIVYIGFVKEEFENISSIPSTEEEKGKFIVHFHGSCIPLHGIDVILKTARALEKFPDIKFQIIGTKIKEKHEKGDYPNIEFLPNQKYKNLLRYITKADIGLGIFGSTEKVQRVIPNKVYESVAAGKATLTADTPAIKEVFKDQENILLSKAADPNGLVNKIKELKKDKNLRTVLSQNSQILFNNELQSRIVVQPILKYLNEQEI